MSPLIPAQRGDTHDRTPAATEPTEAQLPTATFHATHDGTVTQPGCNDAGDLFRTHQATATGSPT